MKLSLDRVAFAEADIPFQVHPKCKDHIDNDRRTQSKERNIDKPQTNLGRGNIHFLSQFSTDTKGLVLHKAFKSDQRFTHNNTKLRISIKKSFLLICYQERFLRKLSSFCFSVSCFFRTANTITSCSNFTSFRAIITSTHC